MNILYKLKQKGFFHIFGANLINKIVQFCSGIFLVRLLTISEYGNYAYAQNILNIIMLFSGLGTTFALLQYGSECDSTEKRNGYLGLTLKIGMSFNILLCIFIIIFGQVILKDVNKIGSSVLSLMFLMPLFLFIFESFQVYMRSSLFNIEFSKTSSLNTFSIFVLSVAGAFFLNTYGVVFGTYIAYIISILFAIFLIVKRTKLKGSGKSIIERRSFFKYSFNSMINNGIAQTIYLIDIFLLGLLIKDTSLLAIYKTATLIPFALNFIPSSIMIFVYPYIAKNKSNNYLIKNYYKKIQMYLLALNAVIVILSIIFSPVIFNLLFGKDYVEAVPYFRILMIGYFISGTFRTTAGNFLAMMKKVKTLIIINLFAGLINIILDWFLIKQFLAYGAALTTVSIISLTALLYLFFLKINLKSANVTL